MNYRIGIASSDGIVVNQHFGRTDKFIIVDVSEDGSVKKIEEREIPPVCEGGTHDDNRLSENVNRLSDCNYLLVSRIGAGASNALEQQGIRAFELPGIISESIHKLLTYVEIENMML